MIEFRVLGAVTACRSGQPVALAPRQRVTLAALLVNAGRITSVAQLYRWLWDDDRPATGDTALHVHVSQLRKRLGLGQEGPVSALLLTSAPGYLLRLGDARFDLVTFRQVLTVARRHRHAGELTDAVEAYRKALAIVRGDPLADLPPTGPVRRAAERIGSEVLTAHEERIAVELDRRPCPDLLAELRRLVARHPDREASLCLLVEALRRDGRRIEALEVLRDGRTRLARRTGTRLDGLERALLSRPVAPATTAVSAQAPAAPPLPPASLIGRRDQIDRLCTVLSADGRTSRRPTALIAGLPGAGKTALALTVAERLAERYPDGRIYVTADDPPNTDPAGPLRSALYALQVTELAPGLDTNGLIDQVRRRVNGRRMLLIVDGVHDERQVAALASAGWAGVLVTAIGTPNLPDAEPVLLDALDEASALELLRRAAGPQRVTAQPDAARRVISRCDRLPAAIRTAGAQLARCPSRSMADLAERLADPHRRLAELHCGDLDVRVSIDRAYRAGPVPARAAFRRLTATSRRIGDDGAREVTAAEAAVALDTTLDEAARVLAALAKAHLIVGPDAPEEPQPTYRFPGLLVAYGHERGGA